MRKLTILLILSFCLPNFSLAQINKDRFDKAIDYVNCQSVYYSLSVISPTKGVTKTFLDNCNCDENPSFDEIFKAIALTENDTKELAVAIDDLKTIDLSEFNEESIISYFENDLFNTSDVLSGFKEKLKDKFSDLAEQIKAKISIIDFSEAIDNSIEEKGDTAFEEEPSSDYQSGIYEEQEAKKGWFSGITSQMILVSIFFSLLSLLLIIVIFLKPKRLYDSLILIILGSQRLENLIDQRFNHLRSDKPLVTTNDIDREIRALRERINELEEDIKKQNERINERTAKSFQAISPKQQSEKSKQKRISETFYLSTPNSDGSFNESAESPSFLEGASIYNLEKINDSTARFEVDFRDSSIKLALQYPDKNIDPVCEAVNAFNPNAKKIVTLTPGEVELSNGQWEVTRKAKIRYE